MWLFFALITITLFLSKIIGYSSERKSKLYISIIFGILSFFMMFRGFHVGNDTDIYSHLYDVINNYSNLPLFIQNTRYELGYVYLNRIIGSIFHNRQWLFIITGGFTAFSFGRFIYQYSEMPWLSAIMFLTLQFFDLSMSSIRQVVAISILMFAYDYVVKKKPIPFILLVLLAYLFHTSSIIFLLIYPLSNLELNYKFYFYSICVAIGIFFTFSSFLKLVGRVFPRYVHYLTESSNSYSNTAKLANVLMLCLYLILFILIKYSEKNRIIEKHSLSNDKRLLNIYFENASNIHALAVWIGIILLFFSLQGTILNRFKYVCSFPLLVAYPNALKHINNPKNRNALSLFSVIVFISYILIIYIFRPEWQSTYPFVPFWRDYE